MVTLKKGQGQQNIIYSSYHAIMVQYIKFGQNQSFHPRYNKREIYSGLKYDISRCWCDIENKVKVIKIFSNLSPFPKTNLCTYASLVKFNQLVQKLESRGLVFSLDRMVTVTIWSRSLKSDLLLLCHNDTNIIRLAKIHQSVQDITYGNAILFKI